MVYKTRNTIRNSTWNRPDISFRYYISHIAYTILYGTLRSVVHHFCTHSSRNGLQVTQGGQQETSLRSSRVTHLGEHLSTGNRVSVARLWWVEVPVSSPFLPAIILPTCLTNIASIFIPSPIVYLNMVGQNTIVLNTKAAAIELLERRSTIYSDRPRFIVAEYLGSQSVMPFTRYGKSYALRCSLCKLQGLFWLCSSDGRPCVVQVTESCTLGPAPDINLFKYRNQSFSLMICYAIRLPLCSQKSTSKNVIILVVHSCHEF